MSKRHVAYVKPDEPSFLKKLKLQAGYKEGPTVDTKREDYGEIAGEDLQDTAEEQPTVVVLKPGDLTAEEAAKEQDRLQKELEETPADLNVPIVFKAPSSKSQSTEKPEEKPSKENRDASGEVRKAKKLKNKTLLSFDEEENDD